MKVEVRLWHNCFHKPVTEFRDRIHEAKTRGEKGKDTLSKVCVRMTSPSVQLHDESLELCSLAS